MPGRLLGHERGYHVPIAAVAPQRKIIEALHHRQTLEGNDHTVSLLPIQRQWSADPVRLGAAIGSAALVKKVSTGELMVTRELSWESLVATRHIAKGEVVTRLTLL